MALHVQQNILDIHSARQLGSTRENSKRTSPQMQTLTNSHMVTPRLTVGGVTENMNPGAVIHLSHCVRVYVIG